MIQSPTLTQTIRKFHSSGRRCVIAVTGGGSVLISDLLAVPGGSESILEAVVPYSPQSLADFLKRAPDQYCSQETALTMAAAALRRAAILNGSFSDDLIGIGITAALASSRPKRGEHRAFIATQTAATTTVHDVVLEKGARNRPEEEAIVAQYGLNALAVAAGGDGLPSDAWLPKAAGDSHNLEREAALEAVRQLRQHKRPFVVCAAATVSEESHVPPALLSGSFNPRHHGHIALRDAAESFLGLPVGYELPIVNADKPPLDDLTIRRRLSQFADDRLVLTTAATFAEKARVLPRSTFVVGVDTLVRVLDSRFYHDGTLDDAMLAIRHFECRFLVAARHDQGEVVTLDDVAVPDRFRDLFRALPVDRFLEDVSSSALRAQQHST